MAYRAMFASARFRGRRACTVRRGREQARSQKSHLGCRGCGASSVALDKRPATEDVDVDKFGEGFVGWVKVAPGFCTPSARRPLCQSQYHVRLRCRRDSTDASAVVDIKL